MHLASGLSGLHRPRLAAGLLLVFLVLLVLDSAARLSRPVERGGRAGALVARGLPDDKMDQGQGEDDNGDDEDGGSSRGPVVPPPDEAAAAAAEQDYLHQLLGRLQLGPETEARTWRVRPGQQAHGLDPDELSSSKDQRMKPDAVVDVGLDFQPRRRLGASQGVDQQQPLGQTKASRMLLPVDGGPRPDQVDASDLLFGVSTSFERIAARNWATARAWERWLTTGTGRSNGADLVIILDKATDSQLEQVEDRLREAGIAAHIMSTTEATSMVRRYLELMRILRAYGSTLTAGGKAKHWIGIIDDSVFFPGLGHLRQRLSRYQPSEKLYLALPSHPSDWRPERRGGGLTTSGGGAVLLTPAALSEIPRLPCMSTGRPGGPFRAQRWDWLLQECVTRQAGWPVHVIPALRSPILDEDLSQEADEAGVESGLQAVLRSGRSCHGLDLGKAHQVTSVCGEGCFLRPYVFRDNWLLINGLSISHHPAGLTRRLGKRRLEAEEPTRANTLSEHVLIDDQSDASAAPPLAWTGRPDVWRLVDTTVDSRGAVWQAYLRKGEALDVESLGPRSRQGGDSLIVVVWEANGEEALDG